jgi:hypothetical protein
MGAFSESVFVLCTTTSALCTVLLLRAYRRTHAQLLIWSALCFLLLTVNNLLVFLDLVMLPNTDLSLVRLMSSLLATSLLVFGFVWDI